MSEEIGNQQVPIEEIGWLAGALDGEGHIGMHIYPTKSKWDNYRIEVAFTNSNKEFLCKVYNVCKKLGVHLYIQKKTRAKDYWSEAWSLRCSKISHLKRLLDALIVHLTCKKERAQLLLGFCNRRLSFVKPGQSLGSSARENPYTSEDRWYFDQFKNFHRDKIKGTPTTIPSGSKAQVGLKRRAPSGFLTSEDIV